MKNWPRRYYYTFVLFIFGLIWAIGTLISENINPSGVGPLLGLLFAYPLIGAIVGFIIGVIADIFKRNRPQ